MQQLKLLRRLELNLLSHLSSTVHMNRIFVKEQCLYAIQRCTCEAQLSYMHTTHNITTLLPGKRKNRPNYDVSITQKKRVKKTVKVESRSRW